MKISRKAARPPRIEMLPLIDIVFLLLVFFIYAMLSMAVHRGQKVDLPASAGATLEEERAIGVTMSRGEDGIVISVDERVVPLAELTGFLRERRGEMTAEQCRVQLFADRDVSYQELFTALDRIREAGITGISLQAELERR